MRVRKGKEETLRALARFIKYGKSKLLILYPVIISASTCDIVVEERRLVTS